MDFTRLPAKSAWIELGKGVGTAGGGARPWLERCQRRWKQRVFTQPGIPPEYKGSETEAVREIRRQRPAAHMELLQ